MNRNDEWNIIEKFKLFISRNEFEEFCKKNLKSKLYKFDYSKDFSEENIFFGTYEEYLKIKKEKVNSNYKNESYNGWVVDEVFIQNDKRKYTMLKCHCEVCNKEKILRADKRFLYAKCNCNKVDDEFEKEWKKIELNNISIDKEKIRKEFKLGDKIYKINNSKEYTPDNIFIGKYEDLLEKKKSEKNKVREEINYKYRDVLNNNQGELCPVCGKRHWYCNSCEHCGTRFNSNLYFYKNEIEEENNYYCQIYNKMALTDKDGEKIFIPIESIKANYCRDLNYQITRIGIIKINKIDYEKEAIIGDFQIINNSGKTSIVDNVVVSFNNEFISYRFIKEKDGKISEVDVDKIPDIREVDNVYYMFLKIVDSNKYTLYIYKNEICIYKKNNIKCIMGTTSHGVKYEDINGNTFEYEFVEEEESETYKSTLNYNYEAKIEKAENFINSLQTIPIFINKRIFKNSECLFFYLKKFKNFQRVQNEFLNDNTENYYAEIDKGDYKNLDYIYFLMNKKSDSLTYFGSSYAIYGYPLYRILRKLIKKYYKELKKIYIDVDYDFEDDYESKNQEKYNFIIDLLLKKYKCDELSLLKLLINKYGICEIFNINYLYSKKRLNLINKKYFNEKTKEMIQENNLNKILWKSEYSLYLLIKYFYPDAIYQYNDEFLESLRYDIYVPSKKIAFEYQGEQHYKPINKFGDGYDYEERVKNDERKRKISEENNIIIIYWKFDELINKIILDEKLSIYEDRKYEIVKPFDENVDYYELKKICKSDKIKTNNDIIKTESINNVIKADNINNTMSDVEFHKEKIDNKVAVKKQKNMNILRKIWKIFS